MTDAAPVIPTQVGTQGDKPPSEMTDDELSDACERECARLDAETAARIRYGIG